MGSQSDLVEERLQEMQLLWRGLSAERKVEYHDLTMADYDWGYNGDLLSELDRQQVRLGRWIKAC